MAWIAEQSARCHMICLEDLGWTLTEYCTMLGSAPDLRHDHARIIQISSKGLESHLVDVCGAISLRTPLMALLGHARLLPPSSNHDQVRIDPPLLLGGQSWP